MNCDCLQAATGLLSEFERKPRATYLDCAMSRIVQNVDCRRKTFIKLGYKKEKLLEAHSFI